MSTPTEIDKLLAEVQRLRDSVQPADRDAEFREMEYAKGQALLEAERMREERDKAVAELEKVKRDVQWTMGKLRIYDLFRFRGSCDMPVAAEGWLPLGYDPKDTERIEWLNKHARAGASERKWSIAFDHNLNLLEQELPDIYNIRDIIDVTRGPSLTPTANDRKP